MITYDDERTLDFILRFWARELVGPSYREIQDGRGITSLSKVHMQVKRLVRTGYLKQMDNHARSLVPLRDCDGTPIQIIFRRADGIEVVI